jgi:hypothetical protein
MTKLSLVGILLLADGLGLLVFAPVTRACTTDGDLTICALTANALWALAGLVLIAIVASAAVLGLPRRDDRTT